MPRKEEYQIEEDPCGKGGRALDRENESLESREVSMPRKEEHRRGKVPVVKEGEP